ncbi:MAG: PIN domain-containing protein [Deltaproteobacteria bacterium]|nr:PIN domain-containing protein [Deltaproteobacteria bacterium]
MVESIPKIGCEKNPARYESRIPGSLQARQACLLHVISAAETVYMSVFCSGELYAGFRRLNEGTGENKDILRQFLKAKPGIKILNATLETAEVFGYVKFCLKKAGTPLPINDVWIAAHALESGAVVITYDARFMTVPGLRLWEIK